MCENQETALITATVSKNERVGKDTYRMILAAREWRGEDPHPGQFLMLRVSRNNDPLLARPFGISRFEKIKKGGEVEIIYRVVGRGTKIMAGWAPGRQADFLGPLGKGFTLPPEGSSSLLIAGGIGLPPLLALASKMSSLGRGGELCILYGEASRDCLLDLDQQMFPGVQVATCTEDGTCGTPGQVTSLLESEDNGKGRHLYICGPNPMLRAVMEMTSNRCLTSQYSLEARMACGFGVCTGCAVKAASGNYVRVCTEGPVFEGSELALHSFGDV